MVKTILNEIGERNVFFSGLILALIVNLCTTACYISDNYTAAEILILFLAGTTVHTVLFAVALREMKLFPTLFIIILIYVGLFVYMAVIVNRPE